MQQLKKLNSEKKRTSEALSHEIRRVEPRLRKLNHADIGPGSEHPYEVLDLAIVPRSLTRWAFSIRNRLIMIERVSVTWYPCRRRACSCSLGYQTGCRSATKTHQRGRYDAKRCKLTWEELLMSSRRKISLLESTALMMTLIDLRQECEGFRLGRQRPSFEVW